MSNRKSRQPFGDVDLFGCLLADTLEPEKSVLTTTGIVGRSAVVYEQGTPSFKDMIDQLRYQTLDATFLAIQRDRQTMQKKEAQYRQLLRLAA